MPGSEHATIYVLLPVHNRRETTLRFVRMLASQTYSRWHLVLIDDGSNDGSVECVQLICSNLSILRGDGNWWWAGSLHQGYLWLKQHATLTSDVALIINDDVEIEPDFLANAISHLAPRSLLTAQQYTASDRRLVEVGIILDWVRFTHSRTLSEPAVNCQSTRGLFLRVSDLMEIGGFHPKLLPHYQSDYEFTMRARHKGFCLTSHSSVRVFYDEAQTGVDCLGSQPLLGRLRIAFSKRYKLNPIYLSIFVLLACPPRYRMVNIARVWKSFFHDVVLSSARA
jgi:GT2 family glycosyltransferase